jgi:hypothetical protein
VTDQDAQTLRTLIAKHGFGKVILELTRVAKGWSGSNPAWGLVVAGLRRVNYLSTVRMGEKV